MLTALVVLSLLLSVTALAILAQRMLNEREARVRAEIPVDRRLEVMAEEQERALARFETAIRQLAASQKKLVELTQNAVRHVGVVRFDAFEDMGGRLSFAAAFLDGRGDGVVITSINGRQDTRCYAKQVENWTSIHNLSDEERQAIREALGKAEARSPTEAG